VPEREAADACGLTVMEFRRARAEAEVPAPRHNYAGKEIWSIEELRQHYAPISRQARSDQLASDAALLDQVLSIG
jgi:hypothetical protein